MTATVTVTGNVGQDPEIRYTQTGKAVCTLSVAATPRKQTPAGEWDDDGEPLWIRADFWERDAETVADAVRRGDRITLAGTLALDAWQGTDGQRRETLALRRAKFLGIVPRPGNAPQASQEPFSATNRAGGYPGANSAGNAPQNAAQALPGEWGQSNPRGYDQSKAPF